MCKVSLIVGEERVSFHQRITVTLMLTPDLVGVVLAHLAVFQMSNVWPQSERVCLCGQQVFLLGCLNGAAVGHQYFNKKGACQLIFLLFT